MHNTQMSHGQNILFFKISDKISFLTSRIKFKTSSKQDSLIIIKIVSNFFYENVDLVHEAENQIIRTAHASRVAT